MMKELLAAHDRYEEKVRNADTVEERKFWRRHLEQMKQGMMENGRQVRGERRTHA